MPGQHALLSPSSASRWLVCTPSARLEDTFPESKSDAADEGTLAHSLGELLIRFKLKMINRKAYDKGMAEIVASRYFDAAMFDHCEQYAAFVIERYNEALSHTPDALIFLEQKLDLSEIIPEGYGTGDVIIVADNFGDFIDLKYGKGVPVAAENNPQLKVYGLGALHEFGHIYGIETLRLTIYQPRIDNVSTFTVATEDLYRWRDETLKPLAALAFEGKGEYKPGAHCRFCRARAVCKANADHNLELAKYEFADPPLLTDEAVSDILKRAETFEKWLKDVEAYALTEAVNNGRKWPDFKVVEGRSNRVYSDPDAVGQKLRGAGFAEEIIYTKKLVGITEMTKALGKKTFDELVGPTLIKPPGKPVLVPESDKRPPLNTAEAARVDFADEIE